MGTLNKEPQGKQDIRLWYDNDETSRTFTRDNDDGYTLTLNKLDWMGIDIRQVFGGGVIQNSTAIAAAITAIGATNIRNIFDVKVWLCVSVHSIGANQRFLMFVAPIAVIAAAMAVEF